jgi:hypothetical protein
VDQESSISWFKIQEILAKVMVKKIAEAHLITSQKMF